MPGTLRIAVLMVSTLGCGAAQVPLGWTLGDGGDRRLDWRFDAGTDPDAPSDDAGDVDACMPSCGVTLTFAPFPETCVVQIPCSLKVHTLEVFADGNWVPRDTTHVNGWDYTDATDASIQLYGDACVNLQTGAVVTLALTGSCPIN
jgi:hypothetical protein